MEAAVAAVVPFDQRCHTMSDACNLNLVRLTVHEWSCKADVTDNMPRITHTLAVVAALTTFEVRLQCLNERMSSGL
jgi:hypothetical protein